MDVVEGVAERRRECRDCCDIECGPLTRLIDAVVVLARDREPLRIHFGLGELPREVRADVQVKLSRHRLGDCHLTGRIERGQLASQHCQLVLPEVLAVEANGNPVRFERRVDFPVDNRRAVQPQPRCCRHLARQMLYVAHQRQQRAGDVDHQVTRLDRLEIAPVSRVSPACPGQRRHRHGSEQSADHRHDRGRLPRPAPVDAPGIQGDPHDIIVGRADGSWRVWRHYLCQEGSPRR